MQLLEAFRVENVERIKSTRLVKSIMEGKPEKQHYTGYLVNVYNYAQHSPTVIALAGSRCVQTHPELGQYLFHRGGSAMSTEPCPPSKIAGCGNPAALFGWLYAFESYR